jgi:hypothetical protein
MPMTSRRLQGALTVAGAVAALAGIALVGAPAAQADSPPTPTLTLISSQNPAPFGTSPTFMATLSPAPTCGSVNWLVDSTAAPTTVVAGTSNGTFSLGPVAGLAVGGHSVAFSYSGCATASATSGSLIETITDSAGRAPTITAQVSSTTARSHGWYRTPVTVTFTCTPGTAPLDTNCPAPVTFSKSEGGQSVTATIGDSAGRTSSVKVTVNVDRIAPTLRVTGATNGDTYRHARHLTCRANDLLSGAESCRIHKVKSTSRGVTTVRWTARATDLAGNSTSRAGHYRVV